MKYPNAKISGCADRSYIVITPPPNISWLLPSGKIVGNCSGLRNDQIYFESEAAAQAFLDKYNYDRDWVALRKKKGGGRVCLYWQGQQR